jgi:septum formation protein
VDRADAMRMLKMISGVSHSVVSAVAVQFAARMAMASTASVVRFATLSDKEIETYVATGEPLDNPGGYAIQGKAAAFIAELRGSYSGVMGLPLHETAELIAQIERDAHAGTEVRPEPVT